MWAIIIIFFFFLFWEIENKMKEVFSVNTLLFLRHFTTLSLSSSLFSISKFLGRLTKMKLPQSARGDCDHAPPWPESVCGGSGSSHNLYRGEVWGSVGILCTPTLVEALLGLPCCVSDHAEPRRCLRRDRRGTFEPRGGRVTGREIYMWIAS